MARTSLAWHNLTHDRLRLLLGSAGVGFAVLLMCMQTGFSKGLYDSTVAVLRDLNADLIVASSVKYSFTVREGFSRRRLDEARSTAGVEAAWPLYVEVSTSNWRTADGSLLPVRAFGFDPRHPVWLSPDVRARQAVLENSGAVLWDERSKADYGRPSEGQTHELAGRPVRVVGRFRLGTDFANDANLFISSAGFARLFRRYAPDDGLAEVDLGLVRLAPGADVEAVRSALAARLPDDVAVYTKAEFIEQELAFWARSTPIGMIFGLGTAMGFLVGMIICYQILYSDVDDHLREFATLKAMGYSPGYFVRVILEESLLLTVLGFIPGLIASIGLYALVAATTGLQLAMTFERAGFILALTVAMCVASGLLALRRLLGADPAELF